jgi:sodium-dependent dicarboxylate transporter 2/3/5
VAAPAFVPTGRRLAFLALGVAACAVIATIDSPLQHYGEHGARPAFVAGVTMLMVIWWLSEALPIHWTACVPLIAYPFSGVFGGDLAQNAADAVLPYVNPYIFLFTGGMFIAAAMQQWSLHRRIALAVMRAIGTEPARLLFGLLAATAFVSLWISNTATATMMVPIGIALVAEMERRQGGLRIEHYGAVLMLAIAYGANVGGIGTKIGSPPNAIFAGFMAQNGRELGFLDYMAVGLPFVLMFLPVVWWVLWRSGRCDAPAGDAGRDTVNAEWASLGRMQRGEWVVLAVFLAAVALWIAGQPLTRALRGQVTAFTLSSAHVEAAIAMSAGLALLVWPVGARRALEPAWLRTVPWGTLLLLGGSYAMAAAIVSSGLSDWLGAQVSGLQTLAPFAQVLAASVATVALSAVAANTPALTVMLNLLVGSVSPAHVNSALFAATIASSCDFALPVGTPPNAIVFASGHVSIPRMARIGVVLDLAAAVLAAAWCYLVVDSIL